MAEISRRAGVGSATLYRNFANRRELLEALYVDEIDAVCEAAVDDHRRHPRSDPHGMAAPLLQPTSPASGSSPPNCSNTPIGRSRVRGRLTRVLEASRPLLRAAQQSREVRTTSPLSRSWT